MSRIRNIGLAPYSELTQDDAVAPHGKTVVYGSNELAISKALNFLANGLDVTLLFESQRLLEAYDSSIQEVITHHLIKLNAKILASHTPVPVHTKPEVNHMVAKSEGKLKKIDYDHLYIEPQYTTLNDIGLSNHGSVRINPDNHCTVFKNIVLIQGDETLLDLRDAQRFARILQGKKIPPPKPTYARSSAVNGVEYFSYGVLEQDIVDTHVGYKKSIAKIIIPSSHITGFIKVLVSMRGKVVGISGIVAQNYPGLIQLRNAVKNHSKIRELTETIDINDPYVNAYLGIRDNITR
jgi:hypothetical protein